MVMTTSEAWTASVVSTFGEACVRSMPSSAMTVTAAGLSRSPGSEPAESTDTFPPDSSCR